MVKAIGRSVGRSIDGGPQARAACVKRPESGDAGPDLKRLENEVIVIIDDEEWARSGLTTLIESWGYRTATFASAEEYLASDMSERTVCLILDVHLPGLSGPDLQAHLIAEARCPPTVFVTGCCEEHVRKRVTEAGALGYLIKPCSEKALLECIGESLAQPTSKGRDIDQYRDCIRER
jgi:FixJ family two-component response regulator